MAQSSCLGTRPWCVLTLRVGQCDIKWKYKVKSSTCYSVAYMSHTRDYETLQSHKWQLIGMSYCYHSALCGHPLPIWTTVQHAHIPLSQATTLLPPSCCAYYVIFLQITECQRLYADRQSRRVYCRAEASLFAASDENCYPLAVVCHGKASETIVWNCCMKLFCCAAVVVRTKLLLKAATSLECHRPSEGFSLFHLLIVLYLITICKCVSEKILIYFYDINLQ